MKPGYLDVYKEDLDEVTEGGREPSDADISRSGQMLWQITKGFALQACDSQKHHPGKTREEEATLDGCLLEKPRQENP